MTRTRLSCGHLVDGPHRGPQAWCVECVDWASVVGATSHRAPSDAPTADQSRPIGPEDAAP